MHFLSWVYGVYVAGIFMLYYVYNCALQSVFLCFNNIRAILVELLVMETLQYGIKVQESF